MSDCLGDLAAALADNELDHDQRDRALSHIAGCRECRCEVDGQRRLKALLANQADPEVSAALTTRLLELPRDASHPTHRDVVRLKRRPRLRSRTAAYASLGVAFVAGVVAAGGESDAPKVRPPVNVYVDEHSATTDQLGPLVDPAGNIVIAKLP